MSGHDRRRPTSDCLVAVVAIVLLALGRSGHPADGVNGHGGGGGVAPGTSPTLGQYLESFALDAQARELLGLPGVWDADRDSLALRVLVRLSLAPPEFIAAWSDGAVGLAEVANGGDDRFVSVVGRATFVAHLPLPSDQAAATGRSHGHLVRVVADDGAVVDVLADAIPRAWPMDRPIDEPVSLVALPLLSGPGPTPDLEGWPTDRPAALLAATRVAWHPPGLPGDAGMDVGLLDGVVDGQRLGAGDADAFYALLAAAGRAGGGAIATAAGSPGSILPLIDPAAKWFASHRGEPVTISGAALRATRIEIDDPLRRRQTGIDHYWEVFVFVPTPLISVGGRPQESYPVVCCVRELPAGMPTGSAINEPLRVSGFALKSYAYPLRGRDGADVKRESPLLVADGAVWARRGPAPANGPLGWSVTALAVAAGLALVLVAWNAARESRRRTRRRRAALPDRWQPPAGGP